jgi:hypothetical protein
MRQKNRTVNFQKKQVRNFMNKISLMKIILFLIYSNLFFIGKINSQDITAYLDYKHYLQVFDKGLYRQLEYLPVKDYKIGGNSIAYIDNKNDFKIYYDGQTFPLVNAADFSFTVTDNLTAYRVAAVLYVFDEGVDKILSYYAGLTEVNDSLIVFYDDTKSTLNIYYNKSVSIAEEALLDQPKFVKSSSNIAAWVNQSNYFTIFYHGNAIQLDNMTPRRFEVGRDIVAYVDDYEQRFRLFYYGDTAMVNEFEPDSFKVGFGIMAYTDHVGDFYIFDKGATKKILAHAPEYFYVKGNCILYSFNNSFNIYWNGETTTLQNVSPKDFQLSNDGIAWIDDNGRLQLFHKGKIYMVSYEVVNGYYLNGNVLKYEVGNNTVNVFYNGKNH